MKRTILITGATDGIGKQIAKILAAEGHFIIIHGRTDETCQSTVKEIVNSQPDAHLDYVSADFSLLSNVNKMTETILQRFEHLNVLINNAGIYQSNKVITPDGFEMNLAVNYLAVYVLTCGLKNLLVKSSPSRIINVSSIAHKRGRIDLNQLMNQQDHTFDGYKAYADSKLMLIYFSYFLADELHGSGVTVNVLHPGVVSTKMLKMGFNMTGEDVAVGAETPVFLAISPEMEEISGMYFDKKVSVPSSRLSYDLMAREEVMNWTKKVIEKGEWSGTVRS
jgi:NAD(P)-dependent dehydrogenase (short-subunit alcohol dehydrogenase family)